GSARAAGRPETLVNVLADYDILRVAFLGNVNVLLADFSLNVSLLGRESLLNNDLSGWHLLFLYDRLLTLQLNCRLPSLERLGQHLVWARSGSVFSVNCHFLTTQFHRNIHRLRLDDLLEADRAGIHFPFSDIHRFLIERNYHVGVSTLNRGLLFRPSGICRR